MGQNLQNVFYYGFSLLVFNVGYVQLYCLTTS